MDVLVDLQIAINKASALAPKGEEEPTPLATAKKAVPLLWLALFDYDDIEIQKHESGNVFAVVTPISAAQARVRVLHRSLKKTYPILERSAKILQRELNKLPTELYLVLFPQEVFAGLRPDASRIYTEQLTSICDVWEKLRQGKPWKVIEKALEQVFPDFKAVVHHKDTRVAGYYLIGSLVDKQHEMDEEIIVNKGQGKDDQAPDALAVGESGLLLGRFQKQWKLMSTGCAHDLRALWSDGQVTYLAGASGTLIQLVNGRCESVELSTSHGLRGMWGLSPNLLCAVGDEGTVLAFNGKGWQPWLVPTRASLHCIAGSGPDNIWIAADDVSLWRFDGYSWTRLTLPEGAMANQLYVDKNMVLAAGGSSHGGELFRFERGLWRRDEELPRRVDWLNGLWKGWGTEWGVIPETGPLLTKSGNTWISESFPVERIHAVTPGSTTLALGTKGKYQVILARSEAGWQIEAAIPELKLHALWVAGQPKPPRVKMEDLEEDEI